VQSDRPSARLDVNQADIRKKVTGAEGNKHLRDLIETA
jgi:hypothetical protein